MQNIFFVITMACMFLINVLILLQPYKGIYRGTGANNITFLIGNAEWNTDLSPGSVVKMGINGLLQTNDDPADLVITMVCVVGTNGCSTSSTAETVLNRPNAISTPATTVERELAAERPIADTFVTTIGTVASSGILATFSALIR